MSPKTFFIIYEVVCFVLACVCFYLGYKTHKKYKQLIERIKSRGYEIVRIESSEDNEAE